MENSSAFKIQSNMHGETWRRFHFSRCRRQSLKSKKSGCLFRNDIALDYRMVERVKVEPILNVEPILRRRTELAAKARDRVRGDSAFSIHDKADAV